MNNYKIQAVIVTYNRKEMLVECIENLFKQTYAVSSILVIDNKSTDGTYELLKQRGVLDKPCVKYKCLDKNIGGAGGFHSGMLETYEEGYDFAWIMDDDVFPEDDCLNNLVKAYDEIEKPVSFVASKVIGPKGEPMNIPAVDCTPDKNGYANWMDYLEHGYIRIKSATFVSLLIPADAIGKFGLPIKDYFIWGDDTEYTTRLTTYYGKAYYVGSSVCIHNRASARALSLYEEKDKNRLKNYYYHVRNSLINSKLYDSKKKYHKNVSANVKSMMGVLVKKKHKECRFAKLRILYRGTRDAVFGKYDVDEVENRLKIRR
ncbi:MAG: glycosyltransferase family 2 protein [Lachnospiraceae bacterium]|nr:glycosyltransferase family 2 protein [Lachnospiraceae bacterium]